jgi:hypothetical protein
MVALIDRRGLRSVRMLFGRRNKRHGGILPSGARTLLGTKSGSMRPKNRTSVAMRTVESVFLSPVMAVNELTHLPGCSGGRC